MTVADIAATPVLGGIAAPAGFRAAGVACGIKKGGLDLALLVVGRARVRRCGLHDQQGAGGAVLVSKSPRGHRRRSRARAWSINSGCANACTGEDGLDTARAMAAGDGARAGCDPSDVLVASTGVIGVTLDGPRS